jgi:hypothetical protein
MIFSLQAKTMTNQYISSTAITELGWEVVELRSPYLVTAAVLPSELHANVSR